MRHLGLCVLLVLVPTGAAGADSVVVVLDSSARMWEPLDGGPPRFVAARLALADWQMELHPDLQVGLRIVGGERPASELSSCRDGRLALPVESSASGRWRTTLDSIRPTGSRPLLSSVAAAIMDLGSTDGRRLVVILTSGEDDCDGSSEAITSALGGGVELRLIGVGLSAAVAERFGTVVPTRNPQSAQALLDALRWAAEDLAAEPPAAGGLRVDVGGLSAVTEARLVRPVTNEFADLAVVEGAIHGEAPPGAYSLVIEDDISGKVEAHGLAIRPGQETCVDFELSPPALMAMDVVPERPTAGADVAISVLGAPPGEHWVSLAPAGHSAESWMTRAVVTGPEDHVFLRTPDVPGELEIRFHERLGPILDRVVTSVEVQTHAPEAELGVPSEAGRFETVSVDWSGPDNPGDYLAFAWPESPATRYGSCVLADAGNPALLATPGVAGRWEIRYVSGLSGRILARSEIEVTQASVTLAAPEIVGIGASFDVAWDGPAANADYVAIAHPESRDGVYLNLHLAELGSPATLVAPSAPGSYEIRYVSGSDNRTLRRKELVVEAAPATLEVPGNVLAGARFEVRWTGPDRGGDFIAIAPVGSRSGRYLDWFFTTAGNPASLAAPFKPGAYEVRYVSSDPREVLASIPVTVEE